MVPSFLFLRRIDSPIAGLEKAKNPSGENVRRLIQIFFNEETFFMETVRICLVRCRLIFI